MPILVYHAVATANRKNISENVYSFIPDDWGVILNQPYSIYGITYTCCIRGNYVAQQ